MLWGARMDGEVYGTPAQDAPWSTPTWDKFESSTQKKVSMVHFGQPPPWKANFTKDPFDKCWNRGGAAPLCSMDNGGATLSDIASGRYDTQIKNWATAVRQYGKIIYLRLLWEMNGTWFQWGKEAAANPLNYATAWRRFYSICKSSGANNVYFVWCPNTIFPGSTDLLKLWPGDDYVQYMGIDGYNWGQLKSQPWMSFGQVFVPTYKALCKLSTKPIIICEVGSTEKGGNKAQWIDDMFVTLPLYERVYSLVWFNWNNVENGIRNDWPIESSTASKDAFARGIKNPIFQ